MSGKEQGKETSRVAFPGVVRNEQFVSSPPSPPHFDMPLRCRSKGLTLQSEIHPRRAGTISQAELSIITQDRSQVASDTSNTWTWMGRRRAQKVLDHVWLGPYSVVRDREFMEAEAFTMVLSIRDSKMAKLGFMASERLAQEMGVVVDYIDVVDRQGLMYAFWTAVGKINGHMLDRHAEGRHTTRPSKVLVCCETGNERSATVVAAYLMTVYDVGYVEALHFLALCRFCVVIDDDIREILKSYEEITVARAMVSQESGHMLGAEPAGGVKRVFADTMVEDDIGATVHGLLDDTERFHQRNVIPYRDAPEDLMLLDG